MPVVDRHDLSCRNACRQYDIGIACEPQQQTARLGVIEIERHTVFVGTQIRVQRAVFGWLRTWVEWREGARHRAAKRLDVDDAGTVISEQIAAIAGRDSTADVEHRDSGERLHLLALRVYHASIAARFLPVRGTTRIDRSRLATHQRESAGSIVSSMPNNDA
jgi:hypothetical protein